MSNKEETAESSGKPTESLEETFMRLRGEGMEDKAIIKKLFSENINTSVGEICRITGLDPLDVGRIKGQTSRWRKPNEEPPEPQLKGSETRQETEEAKGKEEEPMTPRERVMIYGEEAIEELKRERLAELLNAAPGIGARSITWVMKQYELDPHVREDPNALMSLLQSATIKDNVAVRIVNSLVALEDEFFETLQRQRQAATPYHPRHAPSAGYGSNRFPSYRRRGATPPPYADYDRGYSDYGGWGYPPPYYPASPEELVRRVVDELKRDRDKQEQSQPLQVVTITEPLRDAEGKLVYDKEGNPVYRKIVGPISQVGAAQEDLELRFLRKLREYKDITKSDKPELTEERIKTVVKEVVGGKEEKITKEDMEKASQKAVDTALAAQAEANKDERRHREIIEAIQQSGSSKAVGDYHDDSYRLLGQGLNALAHRQPKTAKMVIDLIEKILALDTGPSGEEIEPGARESVLDRISKEYIAEAD